MQEYTVAQTKLGFQSSVGCCAENKTGSYQPPPTSLGANRRVVRLPRGTALCALSFSARRSKRLRTPEEHVCVCVCVCVCTLLRGFHFCGSSGLCQMRICLLRNAHPPLDGAGLYCCFRSCRLMCQRDPTEEQEPDVYCSKPVVILN